MYLLSPFSILDLIKYTFVYLFFMFCKILPILVNFAKNSQAFPLNLTNFNQKISKIYGSNYKFWNTILGKALEM